MPAQDPGYIPIPYSNYNIFGSSVPDLFSPKTITDYYQPTLPVDTLKIQAQVQANQNASLLGQQYELKLEQERRQLEIENALRERLTNLNQPIAASPAQAIDPSQVVPTAPQPVPTTNDFERRITNLRDAYAGTNDPEYLIKAQKLDEYLRQASGGTLSPEIADFINREVGVRPSNVREAGLLQRQQEIGQYATAEERRQKQFEVKQSGKNVPGFQPLPGVTPEDDARKAVRDISTNTELMIDTLDDLEASLRRTGPFQLRGAEAQAQVAAIADLAFRQKERFGGGAAYTQFEASLANAILPRIAQRPDMSLAQIFVESGLGRDPLVAIANMKEVLKRELAVTARQNNYIPIGDNAAEYAELVAPTLRQGQQSQELEIINPPGSSFASPGVVAPEVPQVPPPGAQQPGQRRPRPSFEEFQRMKAAGAL